MAAAARVHWLTHAVLGLVALAGGQAPALTPELDVPPSPPPPPEASYWIMCSDSLRRGYDLVCSARVFKGDSPVSVTLTLKDYKGKKDILVSQAVSVPAGVQTEIRLPIPSTIEAPSDERWYRSYNLTVSGSGSSVKFTESKMIRLADASMAVFVQTDKGIYKFGQLVQFRVLVTDIYLKPMANIPVDIVIEDPKENRIWQRLAVTSPQSGVIDQFSLKLASRAPTGKWKIKVTAQNTEEVTEFEVDDYILPRFEVEIEKPSFGLAYNPELEIKVKAKYVFGKPVTEGDAILQIEYNCWRSKERPITRRGPLSKKGELIVKLAKSELLKYVEATGCGYWNKDEPPSLSFKNFEISANVTERNTRRTQKESTSIRYYDSPLKMNFMSVSPSNYKSGLPYTGYVEFKRQDDTPLTAVELDAIKISINVTYNVPLPPKPTTTPPPIRGENGELLYPKMIAIRPPWGGYEPMEERVLQLENPIRKVPSSGWMPISFEIPPEATSRMSIEVKTTEPFPKPVTAYKSLSKFNSPTNSFLSLSVPPSASSPRVGDILVVNAKGTVPVMELYYQVYAKGIMVTADIVRSRAPTTDFQFRLILTQEMSPSVRILAFYRKEDNDEFVVDALTLNVEGIFQKSVSVSFSQNSVKPGAPVDVIVQGEPNSMVFLASNDKSVGLLKEGNEITQDMVREFLWSLDYGTYFPYMREIMICGGPYYYGGGDAQSVFRSAKVIVLTDALVYSHDYYGLPEAMDGDVALVGSGGGDRNVPTAQANFVPAETVRKFFPENWLWKTYTISDASGRLVIPSTAPDTITSWVTSVFSMHPTHGLSVGEAPAQLITAREMFVTLDLPLSITKGEDYCFTASVFNYYAESSALPVLLTLNKSENFQNIQVRRGFMSTADISRRNGYTSYYLGKIPRDEVESAMFCISPTAVGQVPVQVSALTNVPGLSDAVERVIKVKPEGVPRTTSRSYLVDLASGQWSQDVAVAFPNDTVPGSQYVTFSATGSFLGPVLDNLDDLLRMPYGCGEQNMLNFAPTVFLTDYYFKTNTIDDEKVEKAKEYMLAGYTKELLYEHGKTGAYSTFGNNDDTKKNGSLWLTTFVTKTFAQGEQLNSYQEVFPLDRKVLSRSVYWIINQANAEGEFIEHGTVFNKRMQGGSSKGEALTAYTVIALHEASKVFDKPGDTDIKNNIKRSMKTSGSYLEAQLASITDPYDACIVAYSLHLIGSSKKDQAYNKIETLATVGDGLKYWQRPSKKKENNYWWSRTNDAISIEATAYCLLVYRERSVSTSASLPIIRWLTNQRGPQGGFISTQDTVIGLQALTSVSMNMVSSQDVPMKITVSYVDASNQVRSNELQISKANEMLLQKVPITYSMGKPARINIRAETQNRVTGPSTAMAEVVMGYNVVSETATPAYRTYHKLKIHETGFDMHISISAVGNEPASMTIVRVDIPSGYTPDLEPLQQDRFISRSEVEGDTLVLYYNADTITQRGVVARISMDAPNTGKLAKPKDKSYTVSNYYEPSEEVTKMYSIDENKNLCEIAKTYSFCPYLNRG